MKPQHFTIILKFLGHVIFACLRKVYNGNFLLPEDGVMVQNVVNNKVVLFFKPMWSFQEYFSK